MATSPTDHLCGLGYSPADPRQSDAERKVCLHAERLLNMVHAYCEIRDSWTGWLRGDAMSRTLYERIVPEMRALQGAERRIVDTPSVTLLAVLDYAARARQAVPAYTPRETIDHPQLPVSDAAREACERMNFDAEQAALAARQASAREYAARMTQAIEREQAEEQRRQQAMSDAAVTETSEEAKRARAALEARIAVYERERQRVLADADVAPEGARNQGAPEGARNQGAPEGARNQGAPEGARNQGAPEGAREADTPKSRGIEITWRVVSRGWRKTFLQPTLETLPAFARRLVLVDRGARGGTLRAFGEPTLDGRRETVNGVAVRFGHRASLTARLRRDRDRFEVALTPTQVREMRSHAGRRTEI